MKINRKIFQKQRDVIANIIEEWIHSSNPDQKKDGQILEGLHDTLVDIDIAFEKEGGIHLSVDLREEKIIELASDFAHNAMAKELSDLYTEDELWKEEDGINVYANEHIQDTYNQHYDYFFGEIDNKF